MKYIRYDFWGWGLPVRPLVKLFGSVHGALQYRLARAGRRCVREGARSCSVRQTCIETHNCVLVMYRTPHCTCIVRPFIEYPTYCSAPSLYTSKYRERVMRYNQAYHVCHGAVWLLFLVFLLFWLVFPASPLNHVDASYYSYLYCSHLIWLLFLFVPEGKAPRARRRAYVLVYFV